jgi:pimeloyl-ACP methyl ester carboxylesterase
MSVHYHKGCQLAFEVQGSGPAVVFIQGMGVHGGAWAPKIDALAAHYESLSFDNRGLGRSEPVGTRLTIEQMAEDTLALMDARGWASAHVVGQSMGGLIAVQIALSAGHRVRSLSLLCSFPRGRDALPTRSAVLGAWLRTRIGSKPQRRRALLEILRPASALAGTDHNRLASELAALLGYDRLGHDLDYSPIYARQLSALVRYDPMARPRELAGVSTLVVNATHDRIAPPELGRKLAAAIPGVRFVEIPDASHAAAIQKAALINALLLEHFG